MILPDVNLLLYAYDGSAPQHDRARSWWERALSGREPVGLAWVTTLAFVRIGTHPRVFVHPMSVVEATEHVATWSAQPVVQAVEPGPRHLEILTGLLRRTGSAGNLTTDAHLAALALELGATVCSSDSDFRRFDGLSFENPLA